MESQLEDYPYQFRTAILCSSPSFEAFTEILLAFTENECDICITEIFGPHDLEGDSVDLNKCYIPYRTTKPT